MFFQNIYVMSQGHVWSVLFICMRTYGYVRYYLVQCSFAFVKHFFLMHWWIIQEMDVFRRQYSHFVISLLPSCHSDVLCDAWLLLLFESLWNGTSSAGVSVCDVFFSASMSNWITDQICLTAWSTLFVLCFIAAENQISATFFPSNGETRHSKNCNLSKVKVNSS